MPSLEKLPAQAATAKPRILGANVGVIARNSATANVTLGIEEIVRAQAALVASIDLGAIAAAHRSAAGAMRLQIEELARTRSASLTEIGLNMAGAARYATGALARAGIEKQAWAATAALAGRDIGGHTRVVAAALAKFRDDLVSTAAYAGRAKFDGEILNVAKTAAAEFAKYKIDAQARAAVASLAKLNIGVAGAAHAATIDQFNAEALGAVHTMVASMGALDRGMFASFIKMSRQVAAEAQEPSPSTLEGEGGLAISSAVNDNAAEAASGLASLAEYLCGIAEKSASAIQVRFIYGVLLTVIIPALFVLWTINSSHQDAEVTQRVMREEGNATRDEFRADTHLLEAQLLQLNQTAKRFVAMNKRKSSLGVEETFYAVTRGVPLCEGRRLRCKPVAILSLGMEAQLLERAGKWIRVAVALNAEDVCEGWVLKKYLTRQGVRASKR